MNRLRKGFLAILLLVFVSGCGGGGTTGNGTTVSVTAGISNGTAGSVVGGFENISTATGPVRSFVANPMSITLTSVAVIKTGTVPVSPVNIDRINLTLTPLPYTSIPANTTNALSPAIANPEYANNPQGVGGVIPGPGSLKIDGMPIVGVSDAAIMDTAFLASKLTSVQYRYLATLAFHCVEAYTGAQFLVTQPVGVEVFVP